MHDAGSSKVVHGVRGKDPGVPTVDQIAYETNAAVIHLYARGESKVISEETPTVVLESP